MTINLDQMEREARARLARKLSASVAYHMFMVVHCQLPPDVLRLHRKQCAPCIEKWADPDGTLHHVEIGRGSARLEMVVAINGLTHTQVMLRNVHNFERFGVPGVWLLNETRMGMTIAHCYFEEVSA